MAPKTAPFNMLDDVARSTSRRRSEGVRALRESDCGRFGAGVVARVEMNARRVRRACAAGCRHRAG